MICTEKERETCNVEKLSCEGCYYNKPNKEEIEKAKDFMIFYKKYCLRREIANIENYETVNDGDFVYKNIEVLLQYLDYLEQENAELKTQRDYYKREYSLYNKTLEEAGKALTKRGD